MKNFNLVYNQLYLKDKFLNILIYDKKWKEHFYKFPRLNIYNLENIYNFSGNKKNILNNIDYILFNIDIKDSYLFLMDILFISSSIKEKIFIFSKNKIQNKNYFSELKGKYKYVNDENIQDLLTFFSNKHIKKDFNKNFNSIYDLSRLIIYILAFKQDIIFSKYDLLNDLKNIQKRNNIQLNISESILNYILFNLKENKIIESKFSYNKIKFSENGKKYFSQILDSLNKKTVYGKILLKNNKKFINLREKILENLNK